MSNFLDFDEQNNYSPAVAFRNSQNRLKSSNTEKKDDDSNGQKAIGNRGENLVRLNKMPNGRLQDRYISAIAQKKASQLLNLDDQSDVSPSLDNISNKSFSQSTEGNKHTNHQIPRLSTLSNNPLKKNISKIRSPTPPKSKYPSKILGSSSSFKNNIISLSDDDSDSDSDTEIQISKFSKLADQSNLNTKPRIQKPLSGLNLLMNNYRKNTSEKSASPSPSMGYQNVSPSIKSEQSRPTQSQHNALRSTGLNKDELNKLLVISDDDEDDDESHAKLNDHKNKSLDKMNKKAPIHIDLDNFLADGDKKRDDANNYDVDNDVDNENEDDDDIQITRVVNHPSGRVAPISQSYEINPVANTPVKRESPRDSNEEAELARKRKLIQQSKHNLLQDRLQLAEQRRIDALLSQYGHKIEVLPIKYQIDIPRDCQFHKLTTISQRDITIEEIFTERADHFFPLRLRVAKFRNESREFDHNIVWRTNKLQELHTKLSIVLNDSAVMRNLVKEKAEKSVGDERAEIRYHTIFRYFNDTILRAGKNLFNIDKMLSSLRDEHVKNKLKTANLENMRSSYIRRLPFAGGAPEISLIHKSSEENNIIIQTLKDMYALSNPAKIQEALRYYLEDPPAIPKLPIPYLPPLNNMHPYHDDVIKIDDDDDDADDFVNYDNTPRNQFVFSNANPYNAPSFTDDNDGIQELMEAIQPAEFEEEGLANTPEELSISLLKHQRIGLSWMLKRESGKNRGGILADDMGLGKTVQAMSLIFANPPTDQNTKINLVVGPVSLLQQWQQEFKMKTKKSRNFKTFLFHSSNKVKTFEELAKYDCVLISYSTLSSEWKKHKAGSEEDIETDEFSKKKEKSKSEMAMDQRHKHYRSPFFTNDALFYRIILDEAQNIKNRQTLASRAVSVLSAKYRWCLSGTPIQNKLDELYPLIRFLHIKPYNDWSRFNHGILTGIKNGSGKASYKKVHALLSAILLRRTKDSKIDGKPILTLPEKHIIEETVEMEKSEKEFYSSLELNSAKKAKTLLKSQSREYSSILTLLLRLRQACDHEYLVRLGEDGDRVNKLERYSKGWEALRDYPNKVINEIRMTSEEGFVCIHCSEELAENQIRLLSKCGHTLCSDCHDEYFMDNSDAVMDGAYSAKCVKCETSNLSTMSVDYPLFEAFIEGLDWKQCRKRFELDSKASDKFWRAETIEKFIKEDGKLAVSAKINKTVEVVKNILETKPGEKIIIFSQFLGFFDILHILFKRENIPYLQYDGSMDIDSKNTVVNTFYQDMNKRVLLISLKAGNAGLTLTCANHVIILEPFWNPYVEKQAQDRVHRISQTREVYIHRLLIGNTVEDRIMELQKKKEELVESALDPNAVSSVSRLSRRELGFLFGLNGLSTLEND